MHDPKMSPAVTAALDGLAYALGRRRRCSSTTPCTATRRATRCPSTRGTEPRVLGFRVRSQEALFIHDAVYSYQAREALSIHAWYVVKELGDAFEEGRGAAAAVLAVKAEPHRQRNVDLYEGLPQVLHPGWLCRLRAYSCMIV